MGCRVWVHWLRVWVHWRQGLGSLAQGLGSLAQGLGSLAAGFGFTGSGFGFTGGRVLAEVGTVHKHLDDAFFGSAQSHILSHGPAHESWARTS